MDLQIEEKIEDGLIHLSLTGRLDTMTALTFQERVSELAQGEDVSLLVDMRHLDFISSFGLRVLVMAAKSMKPHDDRLAYFGIQEEVMNILRLGGFTAFMKISDDKAGALALLSS